MHGYARRAWAARLDEAAHHDLTNRGLRDVIP